MSELLEEAKKSYISKEQLIEMINISKFDYVKELELEVITGFKVIENGKDIRIQPLGYEINIY